MKARYGLLVFCSVMLLTAATVAFGAGLPCNRNAVLEAWLKAKRGEWENRLVLIPGYESPGLLAVCRVAGGGPRSDGDNIYLPHLAGDEELLSLAHEYVHLALRHHPLSRDEGFVERMARVLIFGEE
ncbi:MAG: DUF2300 domain-containing protein [Pseudomonadota bacterium]